jgi:PadR family transcriptional regulator PadR
MHGSGMNDGGSSRPANFIGTRARYETAAKGNGARGRQHDRPEADGEPGPHALRQQAATTAIASTYSLVAKNVGSYLVLQGTMLYIAARMTDSLLVQLRKGVLDLCVLAMLARSDGYAYDIASRLAEEIGMGEGTIYPLMRRMQADGLVKTYLEESSSGPPRKYYQLTKAGHAALVAQKAEWNSFTAAVARVLAAGGTPTKLSGAGR